MSCTCRLRRSEHAAQHRGVALGECAAPGLEVDGAADLLVRLENVGRIVAAGRRQLEDLADRELNRHRERIEHHDRRPHDRCDEQRYAVGEGKRVGLGQHGAEDHDQDGHDRRCVGNAGGADQQHGKAGGKRCRQDVDQRIAEQHRADQLLGMAQQPIDQCCLGVAFLLQRVHARPRSARQRRLAHIEERRQREQQQNGCEDEADFQRHGLRSEQFVCRRVRRSAGRAGAAARTPSA